MLTSDGPATRRTSPCFFPQNEHRRTPRSTGWIISEDLLDGHRHRPGDALDGHQLVDAGVTDVLDAAELAQQGPPSDRTQSADAVQHRGEGVPLADHPVEGDGKAVRLVPEPLDEEQRLGIERESQRVALARPEELLVLLGQPECGYVGDPQRLHDLPPGGELALAATGEDGAGHAAEAGLYGG